MKERDKESEKSPLFDYIQEQKTDGYG